MKLLVFAAEICPRCLCQEVLWRENRPVFCLVGLVHRHADPGRSGWRVCLPLRSLHKGLQPSQVSVDGRPALQRDVLLMAPTASLLSKEICEANTTIMCPMCEDTCKPWTLSDSCVYAKVSALLDFLRFPRSEYQTGMILLAEGIGLLLPPDWVFNSSFVNSLFISGDPSV